MKSLTILLFSMIFNVVAADVSKIGSITAENKVSGNQSVVVEYKYTDENELTLVFRNVVMNAGAKGVTGSLLLESNLIKIQPRETYDIKGSFESVSSFSITYVIKDVNPGAYRVIHDDSLTEGVDRRAEFKLNLHAAGSRRIILNFKDNEEDPADPFVKSVGK